MGKLDYCRLQLLSDGVREVGADGLFTEALLRGLRGEAGNKGEVTVNSLYDYIDRRLGSARQRPMMFGQMTSRVPLMQYY